ncbi:MAG TPA: TolC family protein, partial [Polyangiales bacterium]
IASELLRDSLGAYWELWYAQTALGIQQAARELAVRQRDDAQQRVDTGTLAPVEVLAFETELAARDEDVASAEAERKRAELELARLLGGGLVELAIGDEPPPAWLGAGGLVLEQDALANSAEVRERAATLQLAQIRARTAADPQRQRLDLDSYVQLQGLSTENPADAYGEYGNVRAVSGFIGLTYEAPLNGRAQRAAAAKARADVEAAHQDLASVKQRVLAEAHKAEERARAQERSVALAEQTRDIAERQLAAEQARFASGTGTTLQVIEAEARVRSARLRVVRAQADLAQTGLSLAHLTGRLLGRWAR